MIAFAAAAILLGFLGSFHCIGMCGPIALALPVHHCQPLKKYAGITLYNTGRITTYALLGLLFGLLGQSFFMAGFQQALSISIGVLLLCSVFAAHTRWKILQGQGLAPRALGALKSKLGQLFSKKGGSSLFLIGLLNGLLPCGLVYLGIAGAAATGSCLRGAAFMALFGLGTVPAMFTIAMLGRFITLKNRNQIRQAMPWVITVMALLLITRGLNLGIPYLSPAFDKQSHRVSCCDKPSPQTAPATKPCCHSNTHNEPR